jgi:putative PD-(D/E)XK family protein DUF4420
MNAMPSPRHLQREGLQEYLDSGVPSKLPLAGTPEAFLVIDPTQERVAVRVPWEEGQAVDLSDYRHLSGEQVESSGIRWFEFAVMGKDYLLDAYPILCAVADRIQLEGESASVAIPEVLEVYRELLGSIGRLSDDQEVGLFGELLVFEHLARRMGIPSATTSWRGAIGEEHDFGLEDSDVEVKSTTTELRHHWIGTATQLQPTVDRTLWLVSLQFTSAGIGGRTLPMLIGDIRAMTSHEEVLSQFEVGLSKMRWSDGHASLYRRSFRLRSRPAAYMVETGFPAITPRLLERAGFPAQSILRVAYEVDLTFLPPAAGPPELRELMSESGES